MKITKQIFKYMYTFVYFCSLKITMYIINLTADFIRCYYHKIDFEMGR